MFRVKGLAFGMALLLGLSSGQPVDAKEACEKKEGTTDHVILFVSDIHEENERNLKHLLSRFSETDIQAEYICYGGDYAKQFSKEAIEKVRQMTKEYFPNSRILMTTGNHEQIGYNPKMFCTVTEQSSPIMSVSEKGYAIYMLGAMTRQQEFSKKQIADLERFLEEQSNKVPKTPVFIVSHYPIHFYRGKSYARTTKNAKQMVELLNRYSNVVFLYGHNHTLQDDNYNVVHMPGDELEIGEDEFSGIRFAYAAMGAVRDGAGHDIYGMKVTIEHTVCCNKVIFEHVNVDAEPRDQMMICFPIVE